MKYNYILWGESEAGDYYYTENGQDSLNKSNAFRFKDLKFARVMQLKHKYYKIESELIIEPETEEVKPKELVLVLDTINAKHVEVIYF